MNPVPGRDRPGNDIKYRRFGEQVHVYREAQGGPGSLQGINLPQWDLRDLPSRDNLGTSSELAYSVMGEDNRKLLLLELVFGDSAPRASVEEAGIARQVPFDQELHCFRPGRAPAPQAPGQATRGQACGSKRFNHAS